jgi:hypothetical protein
MDYEPVPVPRTDWLPQERGRRGSPVAPRTDWQMWPTERRHRDRRRKDLQPRRPVVALQTGLHQQLLRTRIVVVVVAAAVAAAPRTDLQPVEPLHKDSPRSVLRTPGVHLRMGC